MRLHIGQPPATPDFAPEQEGWTPLKEPSPWVLNLVATPIGILAAVLVGAGWGELNLHISGSASDSVFGAFAPLVYLVVLAGIGFPTLIAVHELIHAVCYPRFGFSPSTMIAVWPSKMLFLAIHFDALRRNRLLLVYAMPLLVISILPLVVCRSLGATPAILVLPSTVNALCAGGDIFCFFLILSQVPRQAIVRNQGWSTWWKAVER
jgi:hypothetical protein